MIRIGITACFFYPDVHRKVFGPKSLSYVENDMFRYICQQGVLPVLIPDLEEISLTPILEELDGFVFQGGSDIAPETYRATPIDKIRWPGDAYRDQYELKIMDFAIRNDKPVLAICRGMQLLNVFFGGTLYQDIGTEHPTRLTHRDAMVYDRIHHPISFVGDNTLSRMYKGMSNPVVNSVHHQAIKEIGDQLEILAVSKEDGLVEALELKKTHPGKVLGVQWHPEFSASLQDAIIPAGPLIHHFLEQVAKEK